MTSSPFAEARSRKPSTKETLLDAAERVIVDAGIKGATTRRVAAEADVNQALVHYHFGSVEEMLVAVLERILERVLNDTRARFESDAPLATKWRLGIEEALEESARRGWPQVWLEIGTLAATQPAMRELYAAHVAATTEIYSKAIVDELRGQGAIADQAAVADLAALMSAVTQGIFVQRAFGAPDAPNLMDRLFETDVVGAFQRMLDRAR